MVKQVEMITFKNYENVHSSFTIPDTESYVGDRASFRERQCLLNTVVKKAMKQHNIAGWEEGYPSLSKLV